MEPTAETGFLKYLFEIEGLNYDKGDTSASVILKSDFCGLPAGTWLRFTNFKSAPEKTITMIYANGEDIKRFNDQEVILYAREEDTAWRHQDFAKKKIFTINVTVNDC